AKANDLPPPQQKPTVAILPLAAERCFPYSAAESRSALTTLGSSPETALTVASWLGNSLEPPPLGPKPESRSGATTMKPCAASSSAISLAQSERPKIS